MGVGRSLSRSVVLVATALLAWTAATASSTAVAAPLISVSPSSDLLDGQMVTVTGSGFAPTANVFVATCPPGAAQPFDCDTSHITSATSDGAGAVTIDYSVRRVIQPTNPSGGPPVDCAFVQCSIGATDDPFNPAIDNDPLVPISFATPHLSVSNDSVATLEPGTNEVVTRAFVTCDRATPISAFATFAQAGNERTFAINQEQCDPSGPTLLFLTGYQPPGEPAFTLNPTSYTLIVAPFANVTPATAGSGATTVTASLDVIDAQGLRAAIVALLADPANVALREQMQQAISARIRQDPVFADAFRAALAAG